MTPGPYIDTGAFAKWYLNESGSEDFEAFIARHQQATISRPTVVEFRRLVGRRLKSGDIDAQLHTKIVDAFEDDIRQGFVAVHPFDDRHALGAVEILTRLRTHALRALDALHLAFVVDIDASVLATADRVTASAANDLDVEVVLFG